jgi:hypothetical protein
VAGLIQLFGRLDPAQVLKEGRSAVFTRPQART